MTTRIPKGITTFIPNGVVTHEECPKCLEPDIKVEHGEDIYGYPMHFEHCPECGDQMLILCFDCPNCVTAEELLTREAFLAIVVYELTHTPPRHWHWLCLNNEARKEMLDNASAKFEKWKAMELEKKQQRDAGPGGDNP